MNKTKNKAKAQAYSSETIDRLYDEISPEEFAKTKSRMLLAARIYDAMQAKGWKKKELAAALNQQPSVITKWLSGTHNFTHDTLYDIGKVLGIKLINNGEEEQTTVINNFYFKINAPSSKGLPRYETFRNYDDLPLFNEETFKYEQPN